MVTERGVSKVRGSSEMAPAGRPAGSKNKAKGEDNVMDKYMTGNEEAWKRRIKKLLTEVVEMRNEVRRDRKTDGSSSGREKSKRRAGRIRS